MPPNAAYIEKVVNKRPFGWIFTDPNAIYSFEFEEVDPFYWYEFAIKHQNLALYAGAVYIFTIYSLEKWMRNRPAFELKKPLFYWNFCLGVFSILGFWRMLPGFLYKLSRQDGFYNSICKKIDINVPMGCWALCFVWSKYIELGDTVFIVLRKRPLVFLQWYHHLVTLIAAWVLSPMMEPVQIFCIVLNYGVHSLMYPYFALKAIGYHIPRSLANVITTLQLAQMILGFAVNTLSMYYYYIGRDCVRYTLSIQLFSVVYGTFLILFGKLFYDSVISPRIHRGKSKQQKHIVIDENANSKKLN